MTINLKAPGSASPTGALFYDPGAFGATGQITKVAGVPVKAALEIQSTEGGFLPPRMTTAQRTALNPVVDGMYVYDTNFADVFQRKAGAWVQQAPVSGFQYATGVLTAANITGMNAAGQLILPAPGAGLMYIVHGFQLASTFAVVFAGGGPAYLQYDVGGAGGKKATASIVATFFALNASSNFYVTGSITDGPTLQVINKGLFITNDTGPFTGGAGTTITWRVWYSVVPTV